MNHQETVMNRYAISHWPDSAELLERLYRLANELPIHQITREKMQEYLSYFDTKCAKSKEMITRAQEVIPGGVQHNLAFNYPFPLAISRADGAYLWDIDGNRYIDFLQAGGPTLLGSNYKPVQEKVIELIRESGPVTGLFHEYELKLAELIRSHMPSVEMFRMLMSGTEACMAAVRAARTFTGKNFIIKIGGAYHGWSDQFVFGMRVPGLGPLDAHGIPAGCYQFTQEVFPNDIDALQKRMEENDKEGGTAAVILEPLGPESGTRPVLRDYNAQVRQLCDRFGALLIFDEVVTGFRMGLGGAQGYFDVKPDLTVFGKCVAGGYPGAGGVGGRRDVMVCYAAGIGGPMGKRAMVGGTLSANPLSCAAGYFAIKAIEEAGAHLKAGAAGDRLGKGLQEIFQRRKLPFVAFNHGSICHMETGAAMLMDIKNPNIFKEVGARKKVMEEMGAAMTSQGIITLAGSRLYTSMADTDEVIDDALERFDRIFGDIEIKG
ncbi:MAG: aminotransferase class III-fold pyridoxal phosphate-dependent enzyme [Spirochaetes bacterium]|nr:aminotransferase class III-fold pyridoxal phosphate-dependent enzyme [Spirochaetota bacterium]